MSPWHDIKQFMAARPKGTRENINWKKSQFARNNLKRFICWSSCWHFCSLFTGRGSVITCSWRQGLISILPQSWSWSNVHFENIIDLIQTYLVAVYWRSWRHGLSPILSTTILSLMPSVLVLFERKRKLDPNILSCRLLLVPAAAQPTARASWLAAQRQNWKSIRWILHIYMFGTVNENSMLNIKTYVWISKWKQHGEFQNICLDRWMIIKTLTYEKDEAG